MTSAASEACCWAILKRHAKDEIALLRLNQLCRDNDRVSSLVSVYNATPDRMLVLDLSRQRMTLETLNHLLRLANSRSLRKYITALSWGNNDPQQPVLPKRLLSSSFTGATSTAGISFDVDNKSFLRFRDRAEEYQRQQSQSDHHQSSASNENGSDSFYPIPSLHLCLRAPANRGHEMFTADGSNILVHVHSEWERIRLLSDNFRRGKLRGVTGSMMKDVVVVGRGVPLQALRFCYLALLKDADGIHARCVGLEEASKQTSTRRGGPSVPFGQRKLKFLTSVDPIRAAAVVADLDAASTMIISIAVQGNEETNIATETMKQWLLRGLGSGRRSELVTSKHMILVTGSENVAITMKPESVFQIHEQFRCEPFTTFTPATLLPLSLIFGWSIVEEFLNGAHDMDRHFVETCPRHNIPVLMGLTDVWNDILLGLGSGRVLSPWTEAFAAYPAFLASLESQTCSGTPSDSLSSIGHSSVVIDGGLHSSYDRSLYQSRVLPSEVIMAMDTQIAANGTLSICEQTHVQQSQDSLLCSMFAHLDELALGSSTADQKPSSQLLSELGTSEKKKYYATEQNHNASEGNRPSMLIMCGKCDAFTCGQLVAAAEHRATVKARIWGIDPFVRDVGSSIRGNRTDNLRDELDLMISREDDSLFDDEEKDDENESHRINLSTKTILGHYASLIREQRHQQAMPE